MKKKPTWILTTLFANLSILPLVAKAPEGRAQEAREAILFHCCKETKSGRRYCCDRCCFFTWDCRNTEVCEKRNRSE